MGDVWIRGAVVLGSWAFVLGGCQGGDIQHAPGDGGSGSSSGSSSSSSGGSTSSSGSSGSSSGSSGGGVDSCANPSNDCIVPPPAPSGGTPASSKHNYAIHTLYIGDTDRTGVTNSAAWKAYGYNLDNLVTTSKAKDVCTLAPGASFVTQADGNGGIDNSFGENILPIVITVAGSDTAARLNTSIQTGVFTNMMYVSGFLDQAGNTQSASGLSGVLLAGGDYAVKNGGATPSWDTTTHWPILPTFINGCSPTSGCPAGTDPVANAQIKFPSAYQAGGTFVSGSPGEIDLPLSFIFPLGPGSNEAFIRVHSAVITFQPKAPGSVTDGTIAGAVVTTDFVNALKSVAGQISTSLCSGSAFQSIAQQIEQASDIIVDPTSGAVSNTAGVSCNGISLGLGFEGTEIAAPMAADIEAPPVPSPDPCGD